MRPTHIVIHHTLTEDGKTVSWDAIRQYHKSMGWREIGYHYGIELINDHYEILVGRLQDEVGAHCKAEHMNEHSLGLVLVGNFDIHPPLPIQLDFLIKLTRSLQSSFSIPSSNVVPHRAYATYKTCPGSKFPWSAFVGGLL